MDYEKKYNNALERALKLIVQNPFDTVSQMMEHVFPELKESEDERIRKELIAFIKKRDRNGCDYDYDKWIAWLEKQGKQKPFNYENDNIPQRDFAPKSAMEAIKEEKVDNANKVEPKFNVGDWIVRGDTIAQILDIQEQYYVGLDINGKDFTSSRFLNDAKIHLWTIQDAKDGDMLVDEDINVIGIFEGIKGMCWYSKFYYSNDTEEFYAIGCGGAHRKEFAKPATKEQHDLLFTKIKEAGYEWNKENKTLKKFK